MGIMIYRADFGNNLRLYLIIQTTYAINSNTGEDPKLV